MTCCSSGQRLAVQGQHCAHFNRPTGGGGEPLISYELVCGAATEGGRGREKRQMGRETDRHTGVQKMEEIKKERKQES